ncbi:hybrid cluster protein [Methanosalsum zhilinae DSM 4017]|uniref:Hydroxylamine reductase n=1 Tax=Methanosalsum zhilinae (strain DSM 4017 / NBRC 107636 / OCM 62 / WeN5) TaxID=679901 RepID=F7XP87_METZD|nr:hydroxylamine reductase [Methanosalsum zhilinae]AEH61384.1 hybrid cluster protein [Methanosalsum zhilinae DSM 4017]
MFCFQCEETAKGTGCTKVGVCGKQEDVANLQDQLVYLLKGIAFYNSKAREHDLNDRMAERFILDSLFATLTNTNFSEGSFEKRIEEGFSIREQIRQKLDENNVDLGSDIPSAATVKPDEIANDENVGVLATEDEDIRSLRELLTYGMKGMAAYAHHAAVLGYTDDEIFRFFEKGLLATLDDSLTAEDLTAVVMECGKASVTTLALLDSANTGTYGHQEPTKINIGTGKNPGILISGHDLKDMEQLLEQSKGSGVDIYTHGEMIPANAYPSFKKYDHFVGNYGNSWWKQKEEFEKFNGPILMTTNCIVPPKGSYLDRLYTTSIVGYDGARHIDVKEDGTKDFSALIEQAKECQPPVELETGNIMGGFAHNAVLSVADKVIDAVKSGKISRFVVMAGCDGRHKEREYYTEFAKQLPESAVILTAGCAKYRYNKLDLGEIDGIPRILDAGQCNDSYSLVVIAQKLAEAFGMDDINELPISYNIAWYEQKSVAVLLALLSLGVKDMTIGPRLPAFVSPAVLDVLVDKFNITKNTTVEEDMERLL